MPRLRASSAKSFLLRSWYLSLAMRRNSVTPGGQTMKRSGDKTTRSTGLRVLDIVVRVKLPEILFGERSHGGSEPNGPKLGQAGERVAVRHWRAGEPFRKLGSQKRAGQDF